MTKRIAIGVLLGIGVLTTTSAETRSVDFLKIQAQESNPKLNVKNAPSKNITHCKNIVFDQYRFYSTSSTNFTVERYIAEFIPDSCAGITINIQGGPLHLPSGALSTSDYTYRISHEFERRFGKNWADTIYTIEHENKLTQFLSGDELITYLNKKHKNRKAEIIYISQ